MGQDKLFLIDAYAIIYRAYYALIRAPRVTSKGFNTSAIFGFCNTLDEILRKENPTHIAVCFDPPHGKTFRHEAYEAYKATRESQPEDITLSIPYIKDIIRAYNIPVIEIENYEADDVIGSLSRIAEKEGVTTYMMTPDKDYGQLVTDKVLMYRPAIKGQGFEVRGVSQICERYGIDNPLQVIDLLALEGDTADNIPGCPGVGEKTASKLIKEYGSVENLIDHVADLKGALQKKVSENIEQIKFSKYLATIKTDVPLDIRVEDLVRKQEDVEKLKKIYRELEFKSFLSKLGDTAVEADKPVKKAAAKSDTGGTPSLFDFMEQQEKEAEKGRSISSISADTVTVISTSEGLKDLVSKAVAAKNIGIATYSIGVEAMTAILKGIAVAVSDNEIFYVPLLSRDIEAEVVKCALQEVFGNENVTVVSHDVKRDIILLKRYGVELTAKYFDTSVAHYLLQPEMKHNLNLVAATYLSGYQMIGSVESDAPARKPYTEISGGVEQESTVIAEMAKVVLSLADALREKLRNDIPDNLVYDIEMPFVKVLASMEWEGMRIDANELSKLSVQLTQRMKELEAEAYTLAGQEFNISSPMQVGEVLFDKLQIDPKAKKTKRGTYSTTEEILEKYASKHPIVNIILEIRGLRKLLTTYINALPLLVNPKTGKIHTTLNQTVTATGRISSTNPNLQNIPVRTDDGREIRRAFVADPGCVMLSADYSQIELRILACLSGDEGMIDTFLSGADFHTATAAKIYNEDVKDVTQDQRRKAKTANFGIVYGISAFGLSERLGIPRAEAKSLIETYFETYPGVNEYLRKSVEVAQQKGYVTTLKGRKRYLPDINSRNAVVRGYAERNAVNAPIQGSAADIIKCAMIDIYADMKAANLRSKMIMQIHDELIFNVFPDELEVLKNIVESRMKNAYKGRVPLEVAAGVGHNWLEAH